jgi:hypothetical protein
MGTPTVETPEQTPESPAEGTTEQVAETPELTPEQVAARLKEIDESGFLGILVDKATAVVTDLNTHKTRLRQIGGDKAAFAESVIESDDEEMRKYRDALAKLRADMQKVEAARDKIVDERFESSKTASKDEIDSLTAQVSMLEKQVQATRKLITAEHPEHAAWLQSLLPKVVGSYSGGAREGMGEGGRKLRNFTLEIGDKSYESFSKAAVALGVKADVLQTAYLTKVGANINTPAKDLPVGVTEFAVDVDGKSVTVKATRSAS